MGVGRNLGEPKNELGQWIKSTRLKKDFNTQEALAKACELRVQEISKYETGGVIPRKEKMKKLESVLGFYYEADTKDTNKAEQEKSIINQQRPAIQNIVKERIETPNQSKSLCKKELEGTKPLITDEKDFTRIVDTDMDVSFDENKSLLTAKIKFNENKSENIISLSKMVIILKRINKSWIIHDNEDIALLEFIRNNEFFINEHDFSFLFDENYILVKSPSINNSLTMDSIGWPTAYHYSSGTYQTVWVNFQLNDHEKVSLLDTLFKKENLHYYNVQLSWLAMKIQQ